MTETQRQDSLFESLQWGMDAISAGDRTYGDLIPRLTTAIEGRDLGELKKLRREDFPWARAIGAMMDAVDLQ